MEGVISAVITAVVLAGAYYFFKKTENYRWLIARIAILGAAALLFFISMIVMLANEKLAEDSLNWLGFVFLPFVVILVVLLVRDIKILKPTMEKEKARIAKEAEETRKLLQKQEQVRIELERQTECKRLLEQCGLHFFIKYYSQIKRLPLRDISVEENYTSEEKNERLYAAKEIVEDNLTAYATNYILQNFSDVLEEEETVILQKINAELK